MVTKLNNVGVLVTALTKAPDPRRQRGASHRSTAAQKDSLAEKTPGFYLLREAWPQRQADRA